MEPESSSSDPLLVPSPIPNANSPIYSPIRSDSDSDRAVNIYTFSNQHPSNSLHDVNEEVTSNCTATATSTSTSSPSKRTKFTHSVHILDRLSQLPDSLIHQILSLLPINDAVASATLSKRWRHTWTSTPNLIFKQRGSWEGWDDRIREFVYFVNNTVLLYGNSNLKRFALDFEYFECFASEVTSWIRFATRRNAEEIDLNFYGDLDIDMSSLYANHYRLPQFFFDYALVKSLNFRFCEIDPGREISWKLLKNLSIRDAVLSNELVEKILRGSPVLESLELYRCGGITRLDVKSVSLRTLVVEDDFVSFPGDEYECLEISGNNLRSLSLVGLFYRTKMKVANVGALVDLRLDFQLPRVSVDEDDSDYEEYRSIVREIFNAVHHVAEVTVGKWCIQVLSMCELKAAPSPLSKHKLLKVNTHLKYWDLPGIARLLRSSPDLETLVLNMACSSHLEVRIGPNIDESRLFGDNDWALQEMRFSTLLLNLHTIKIVGFIADTSNCGLFVSMMKFLLENAKVLKKMVIYPQRYDHNRWRICGKTKDLLNLAQSLLSFPRSSSEAEILLYPMKERGISLVKGPYERFP